MIPMVFAGCDSLFDTGDTEAVYEGPTVVAFFPLQQVGRVSQDNVALEVQLIGEQRSSAVEVTIAVDGSSTAVSGTHFTLPSTTVTIAPNTSIVNVPVNLIEGSISSGEVDLFLNITGASGDVEASENLKQARVIIRP